MIFAVLLVLSVTLSSPLLALNTIFHCPLPIPVGLFESQNALRTEITRGPSRMSCNPHEPKRSMSTSPTVVEGRRSCDVWITMGDAVNSKNKIGRAVEMLRAMPKLSVLTPEEVIPPIPIRTEFPLPVEDNRLQADTSAQFGRARRESESCSHFSRVEESLSFTPKIMVAQRHYSAPAQTLVVSNSEMGHSDEPNQSLSATTSIAQTEPSVHPCTRPISSISGSETASPANSIMDIPSDPLPPTLSKVPAAHLTQLKHQKSFSSGFSSGPVGNVNEIDALTAGVLPWLVPGLKVGDNMKIKNDLPGALGKSKGRKVVQKLGGFCGEFSSPEIHSTPVQRRPVFGADSIPNHVPSAQFHAGQEGEECPTGPLSRSVSTRSLGLSADVFHNIDEAKRSPLTLYTMLPPASAVSSPTLFEDFAVGLGSPLAESTPQNAVTQKPTSRHPPPPLPLNAQNNSA